MCEELDAAPRGAPGSDAALIRLLESAIRGHGRAVELNRPRGGAKKDVRRARWQDEFTAVVYVWDPSQDYIRAHHAGGSADREDEGEFDDIVDNDAAVRGDLPLALPLPLRGR